ncbi:5241_t:CDS:2 [Funneliformis geosporum]|uniref:4799_t:CDS:1 n=1 Tax=Funneliformis geosporum TaxID=1117311 RepID=A0A9W4SI88_9GLOM|nr:4799_t:CDS:2 [Funneliformis geosporum]CAI2171038.1 5241_t:CDS:2 [Funneliformis geosporum]
MTEADLTSFLLKDIESLYGNNEDCNVTIKVKQDSFKAHSVILKARSEYFRKSINECLQKRISLFNRGGDIINLEITNMSPRAFRICLKYMYTGKFSLDDYDNEFIFNLAIAADALSLLNMVNYLQTFLIEEQLNWIKQNLVYVHQTCLIHDNFAELQVSCWDLINQDPALLFQSKHFHRLDKDILLDLIKRDDISLPEVEIWHSIVNWGMEQLPSIIEQDKSKWKESDFNTLKDRLKDFIPHIRFFTIPSDEYYNRVRPLKKLLLQSTVDQLEEFYLVRNLAPPINEKPRKWRRNPAPLRRYASIFKPKFHQNHRDKGEPASEFKPEAVDEVSTKPLVPNKSPPPLPVFRLPDFKFNSKLIDNTQIKRILSWIDGEYQAGIENLNPNNNFTLLARGSRDGINPEAFTSRCKDKGPTEGIDDIIYSEIKDSNAAIFDGDGYYGIGFGSDLHIFSGKYVHKHYKKRIINEGDFAILDYEAFQFKKKNIQVNNVFVA